jgi:hypothetical protein
MAGRAANFAAASASATPRLFFKTPLDPLGDHLVKRLLARTFVHSLDELSRQLHGEGTSAYARSSCSCVRDITVGPRGFPSAPYYSDTTIKIESWTPPTKISSDPPAIWRAICTLRGFTSDSKPLTYRLLIA